MTELTDIDKRVIRRALKRLRYETISNIARSKRNGWKPQPGKIDANEESVKTIDSLLERIPFPDYPVVIGAEPKEQ